MAKIRSIGVLNQPKKDVRGYDALHNLDKRIAAAIDKAVREKLNETFFLGYYIDGGYVGVNGNAAKFKSPIDSYQYTQNQVKYVWSLFSTRTADATNPDGSAFVNGQLKRPQSAALSSGAGTIIFMEHIVNQDDGSVNIRIDYLDGAIGTQTNDGILAVFALCQRSSPK